MNLPRRFRSFSLRTLMVLVGVAGVLAWVARERDLVRRRYHARWSMGRSGGIVCKYSREDEPRARLPFIRRIFGDWPVEHLLLSSGLPPDELAHYAKLFPEAELIVGVPQLTQGGESR